MLALKLYMHINFSPFLRTTYWVQVVTRAFYKISCQMAVCVWEEAYMGINYDFNLLIYLLAIRIGTPGSWDASTMHTCHICVGVLTIPPNMKVVAIVYFSWI